MQFRITTRAIVLSVATLAWLGCSRLPSTSEEATADSNDTLLSRENPVLHPGNPEPDGRLGSFTQSYTFDCFFLTCVIALANDADGIALVESSIQPVDDSTWEITFANVNEQPVVVNKADLSNHRLVDGNRQMTAHPVAGDPDVQLLEIAADKLWRDLPIKPEGLWDDVPMNAFAMFSDARQNLIWNRSRASAVAVEDIDKYRRLPSRMIHEEQMESLAQAEERLAEIVASDSDGISMVMIDYERYHAVAIIQIDLNNRTYQYIDPGDDTSSISVGDLDGLLHGIANGLYAINYLENGQD